MGWERKRGKLREFNQLLRGRATSYVDDAESRIRAFGHVRYVITLDEDTEIERDGAALLIGTIDHPLNRPVLDPIRRVVIKGFGIVEPHPVLRFQEASRSIYSRLFGGFPGIETYASLVSDLHVDLFGEGMFHGKGIYDVDVVELTMEGRIPENRVLSHDLLEGLYARAGTANTVHFFDGFPSNFREFMQRSHRWIRGDWQIAGWLFSSHGRVLSLVGKYRIFENLRRSVVPIATVAGVFLALFSPALVSVWSAAAIIALGSSQIVPAFLRAALTLASLRRQTPIAYRVRTLVKEVSAASIKTVLLGIFALHSAVFATDAIIRGLWRTYVSHRRLLEWQIAYDISLLGHSGVLQFVRFTWRSVGVALALLFFQLLTDLSLGTLALVWSCS
jgi:hypothetical protein